MVGVLVGKKLHRHLAEVDPEIIEAVAFFLVIHYSKDNFFSGWFIQILL